MRLLNRAMDARQLCNMGAEQMNKEVLGPDGLPADDPQSKFWLRYGEFVEFPGGHTRASWEAGPAASSHACADHLPEG